MRTSMLPIGGSGGESKPTQWHWIIAKGSYPISLTIPADAKYIANCDYQKNQNKTISGCTEIGSLPSSGFDFSVAEEEGSWTDGFGTTTYLKRVNATGSQTCTLPSGAVGAMQIMYTTDDHITWKEST